MLNTFILFVTRKFLESRALKFLEIVKGAMNGRAQDAKMENSTFFTWNIQILDINTDVRYTIFLGLSYVDGS